MVSFQEMYPWLSDFWVAPPFSCCYYPMLVRKTPVVGYLCLLSNRPRGFLLLKTYNKKNYMFHSMKQTTHLPLEIPLTTLSNWFSFEPHPTAVLQRLSVSGILVATGQIHPEEKQLQRLASNSIFRHSCL